MARPVWQSGSRSTLRCAAGTCSLTLRRPVMPTRHGSTLYLHAAAHRVGVDTPIEGHLHLVARRHGEAQMVTRKGSIGDRDIIAIHAHGAAYLLILLL